MEPEGLLSCSQQPPTGSYPEPDESGPQIPNLFPKILLKWSFHLRLGFLNGLFPSCFPKICSYTPIFLYLISIYNFNLKRVFGILNF